MIQIINISPSNRKSKRLKATLSDGKSIHFGLKNGPTYIDHHNNQLRELYWKRHYANPLERDLIDNLVPSPAVLSLLILWGISTNIRKNVKYVNKLFRENK